MFYSGVANKDRGETRYKLINKNYTKFYYLPST